MEKKSKIHHKFTRLLRCCNRVKSYSEDVKTFIDSHSTNSVKNIIIVRTPIEHLLQNTIYLLAPNAKKDGTLYHLQLILTLDNEETFILEKCATINIESPFTLSEKSEQMIVDIDLAIPLPTLLENTKKIMGKKRYFWYSAKDSNCQDFALSVLKGNNLFNTNYETFIKQNTSNIFEGKEGEKINTLFNVVTDIDANVIMVEENILKIIQD
jgi:hypothetical protein